MHYSRRAWLAVLLCVQPSLLAAPVELVRESFDEGAARLPVITVMESLRQEQGTARSASLAGWRREGVQVGTLPIPQGALVVEYDFRAVRFGSQGQEFTSQTPSTHWYM
ncbi:MAG: hypothetical protein CO095_14740, partial [Armatimonadetes bacterium CG_4_9_14_3_um_filter_58_7]